MRACLVFNPNAGSADRIKDFLLQLTGNHRCELRPTSRPEDVKSIAREAVDEGFDRLIVGGGDGTICQAINGIAPDFSKIELAILPFGTGNDLARSLGLTPEKMDLACRIAFESRTEPIDVVRIRGDSESYFINVANGGFGGRIAEDVQPVDKKRWGPMAYWVTSITRVIDLAQFRVSMRLDDRQLDTNVLGVAIGNGRYVGGGFPIAREAILNDGLIDVTTIPVLPPIELMAAGFNFMLARDQREDRILTYRVSRFSMTAEPKMPFSIDGEPTKLLSATYEVIPRALRVVVGHQPPGLIDVPA